LILFVIVVIRGHQSGLLSGKLVKLAFRWGSAPDSAGRAYNTPPVLLAAVFKEPTSKSR